MRKILFVLLISCITLNAHAQLFGKKWSEGHYYDRNGAKFTGLMSCQGDKIYFKIDKKSKEQVLQLSESSSYVDPIDSFVVSHNEKLKKTPFLNVIIKHYTLNLYGYYLPPSSGAMNISPSNGSASTLGGNSAETIYYYGPNPDDVTKLNKKQFEDVMIKLMADKPEVIAKIKDKTFSKQDIHRLVEFYITGKMPDPINKDNVYPD